MGKAICGSVPRNKRLKLPVTRPTANKNGNDIVATWGSNPNLGNGSNVVVCPSAIRPFFNGSWIPPYSGTLDLEWHEVYRKLLAHGERKKGLFLLGPTRCWFNS